MCDVVVVWTLVLALVSPELLLHIDLWISGLLGDELWQLGPWHGVGGILSTSPG
jgi:hypothetical protein